MKAAILTLALAIFMLGASATYVKATGGFNCEGSIYRVEKSQVGRDRISGTNPRDPAYKFVWSCK